MLGRLGAQELILVLAIVLLIFGPRKLPEIGSAIGKSIKGFKQATSDLQAGWESEEESGDGLGADDKL